MASLHPRPLSASASIHNIVVGGHRTSVRLEPSMWDGLRDIARLRGMGINDLVTEIDERRAASNLTAAIRVYVLDFYRSAAAIARDVAALGSRRLPM